MDISESPYFFPGSAGKNCTKTEQFALYDPITDRFVLVSKFEESLRKIAILFSSRYQLHICLLHTADNFHSTLIDNSCCYNWTTGIKAGMVLNESIAEMAVPTIHRVIRLVESEPLDKADLIVQDQEYLLAAVLWATSEEKMALSEDMGEFYESEVVLDKLVDLPFAIRRPVLAEITDIIFNEFTLEVAALKINKIRSEAK